MDVIKRIKEWIAGRDRKKLIENSAIVVIIGIIIIIAGSTIFSGNKPDTNAQQQKAGNTIDVVRQSTSSGDLLETKLKSVLAQMQGVGKVEVMITYESSGEEIPAYDIKKSESNTQEKDNEGGTRSISEEDSDSALAYEDTPEGGKAPVILKETEPEVRGVLVVAEGADNVTVRQRIISAVTVVLDVPIHKVEVSQRRK